jgi:hypothetical protein
MTPEDKLKDDHAELIMVWKWYKANAYTDKSDSDWERIGQEATRLADSLRTELGKLLVNAALTALNREGRE